MSLLSWECKLLKGAKDDLLLLRILNGLRRQVGKENLRSGFELSYEAFKCLTHYFTKRSSNPEILSVLLSILGNLCTRSQYQKWFCKETKNLNHLIAIIRTIETNHILCRAWRLCGTLISSHATGTKFMHLKLPDIIANNLIEMSKYKNDTKTTILRALEKWLKYNRSNVGTNLFHAVKSLLMAEDNVEALEAFPLSNTLPLLFQKSDQWVDHGLFMRLIEMSRRECNLLNLDGIFRNALYTCICHVKENKFHELIPNSGIAEFMLDAWNKNERSIYYLKAMNVLSNDSCLRNKFLHDNNHFLDQLTALFAEANGENKYILLQIFWKYHQNNEFIMSLATNETFVEAILKSLEVHPVESAALLHQIMMRTNVFIPAFVTTQVIEWHVANKDRYRLLEYLLKRHEKYFEKLLLTGKLWLLAGLYNLQETVSVDYALAVIEHILAAASSDAKENAILAVPFFLDFKQFSVMYKILKRYDCLTQLVQIFKNDPLREGIAETMTQLIQLLSNMEESKESSSPSSFSKTMPYVEPNFDHIQNEIKAEIKCILSARNNDKKIVVPYDEDNVCLITLRFTDNETLTLDKEKLISFSPVFTAMLKGYFIESIQQEINMISWSVSTFQTLMRLFEGYDLSESTDINIWLELISFTDHYLIGNLSDILVRGIPIKKQSFGKIYAWARQPLHSSSHHILRDSIFRYLFSHSDNMKNALKNSDIRNDLVLYCSALVQDYSSRIFVKNYYINNSCI